jgi:hypothetical protein
VRQAGGLSSAQVSREPGEYFFKPGVGASAHQQFKQMPAQGTVVVAFHVFLIRLFPGGMRQAGLTIKNDQLNVFAGN